MLSRSVSRNRFHAQAGKDLPGPIDGPDEIGHRFEM
jgi:hypothetical protein